MKNFKIFVLGLGLGLCGNAKAQTFIYSNKPKEGPIMIVAGITLTTTSIIQNNVDGYYSNTYSNFSNTYTVIYNKPNILTNYPNNFMFGLGVTITVTGLFSTVRFLR